MSRRIDFTLTEDQLGDLEQAINTSPYPEVRQRAIAVRMLHLGQHPERVAEAVMVTSNTIYAWHKRWREQGIGGLRDGHRTGRPAKADQAYIDELARLLGSDPRDLGLPFTIWTINRLRLYLSEQTGILLSYTRFRALLSREGYRWKEPKHDLSYLQDRSAIEHLLEEDPRQHLILVMDNASYHHSKTVRAALSLLEDRLLVIWLPTHSSFLNPIERFWLHFKQLAVANRLHRSLEALDQTVTQVMADQNTFNHPNRLRLLDKFRLVKHPEEIGVPQDE